jgi:hypothetical protein
MRLVWERWLEADLRLEKGQLVLRQGHPVAAEGLYSKALCIAREQEAKLWKQTCGNPRRRIAGPAL